ncbi:unnamed protein product [Callosobruchus maculatus]|uniref:DUF4794 domain-containing protein n=1 Tax=Callosobruchus maculatus TaxID=64391 RepID=A0A653BKM6_CALMS|nr:unnamed protein product [Callosobruchus maculatus]
MKLTLWLLALLGYVIHTTAAVLQYEEILIHPGIIGGIFKGPNSETIIQGPDGSAITAEQIGGAVEAPDVLPSAAIVETAVNSLPVSSTVRPELRVTPTLSSVSLGRVEISSLSTPIGSPETASVQPILIPNKPVPVSTSGIEVSTLTPSVVYTSASPIQPSSPPLTLSTGIDQGSSLYGSRFFTASEPANVLLPPSTPAPSTASVNVYRKQPVTSNQAIDLRPVVSSTAQPILLSSPGNLRLPTGYSSNVLEGSTARPQYELSIPSAQQNPVSTVPAIQPEASIGVVQQPFTSTLPPVNLVPNSEAPQKSNIQRIPSTRPSAPVSTVAVNNVRYISQPNRPSYGAPLNNLSVPVAYYSPQSSAPIGLQNVRIPNNAPVSTRQNIFTAGNRYNLVSPSEPSRIVSSTVTPLAVSNWASDRPTSNHIQQIPNVENNPPRQAIQYSSGGAQGLNEVQTRPKNILIQSTSLPDAAIPPRVEPLNNQVPSYPANAPTKNIIPQEIAVPRAPGIVTSTAAPAIGSNQQKLELSPLPNNKGVVATYNVGQNGRPQQILLAPLPEGAIELGATISSQTRVTDRLEDVAPSPARQQKAPPRVQYEVYQAPADNSGLLSNTNPVITQNQNRVGPIPIDSRPLTFDIVPQGQDGVVLPPSNFDDSTASILWNRYERSSEKTI